MIQRKIMLTGDGSHTILVPELKETYHSTHGALRESRHVFIAMGLDHWLTTNGSGSVRIFEVGFGTGLNALLSLEYATDQNVKVSYESIELFPLSVDEVSGLNYTEMLEKGEMKELFDQLHTSPWEESVPITPNFELIKRKVALERVEFESKFDVCFFDAFAPSKQPEMWEIPHLQRIYNQLERGGVYVTYCAKGQLKRDLREIGFEVETLQGPPGKKEMVRAIKNE